MAAPGKGQLGGSTEARGTCLCEHVGRREQLSYLCLTPPPFIAHLYFWRLHPRLWHLQDLVIPPGLGQLQCGLPELLSAEISSLNKHH